MVVYWAASAKLIGRQVRRQGDVLWRGAYVLPPVGERLAIAPVVFAVSAEGKQYQPTVNPSALTRLQDDLVHAERAHPKLAPQRNEAIRAVRIQPRPRGPRMHACILAPDRPCRRRVAIGFSDVSRPPFSRMARYRSANSR